MIEITDGSPVHRGVAPVDRTYFFIYLRFQLCITSYVIAGRNDYHCQCYFSMILWMMFEKTGKAMQPVEDSFAIVQPVYG